MRHYANTARPLLWRKWLSVQLHRLDGVRVRAAAELRG